MHFNKGVIRFLRPWLPIILIIAILKLTGQLNNVISFGQSAVLKSGILNASAEAEEGDDFDFNFTAFAPNGDPLTMDSLKGKVIFLNLWATWCGPCRSEMPTIQSLYESIDKNNISFVILSIDRVDQLRKVNQYIEKNGYTFPVYILQGNPTDQIHVPTIPTTFVISKKGKIIFQESGMRNYDTNKFRKFLLKEVAR